MQIKKLTAMLGGVFGAALFLSSSANAAVFVFEAGAAQDCFKNAELGGNAADGINVCTRALDTVLTPADRAATFVNRGVIKLRAGQSNAAVADVDRGLSLDPSMGDGYVDRGAVMIAIKHYDEALVSLNKGLTLGVHHPHIAYYDRAIANELLGNVRGAYDDYKRAVEIRPDFTPASEELKRFKVTRKPEGV